MIPGERARFNTVNGGDSEGEIAVAPRRPVTFLRAERGLRVVLPSPNGAALSRQSGSVATLARILFTKRLRRGESPRSRRIDPVPLGADARTPLLKVHNGRAYRGFISRRGPSHKQIVP